MSTFKSRVPYTGDGVTTAWSFSFDGGYISPEHVKIKIGDAEPVQATLQGTGTVEVTPAISAGVAFEIFRDTPDEAPLVDWANGADITESNLDTTARQSIFVAAEALDRFQFLEAVAITVPEGTDPIQFAEPTELVGKMLTVTGNSEDGFQVLGVTNSLAAGVDSANRAEASAISAAAIQADIEASRTEILSAVSAADNPDGNTATILAAATEAKDALGRLYGVFSPDAVSIDPYMLDIITDLEMFDTNGNPHRVQFMQTNPTSFVIDIWDEVLGGPVAHVSSTTDWTGGGKRTFLLVGSNRAPGVPGWGATAGPSGIRGYITIDASKVVPGGAVYGGTSGVLDGQNLFNPRRVSTRFDKVPGTLADPTDYTRRYKTVLRVGAGEHFPTWKAAAHSFHHTPLANPDLPNQIPSSSKVSIKDRVLLYGTGEIRENNIFLPEGVDVGGPEPDALVFKSPTSGSIRPIFQVFDSNNFFFCTINPDRVGQDGTIVPYGIHLENTHLRLTRNSADQLNYGARLSVNYCRLLVGGNIQVLGAGLPAQTVIELNYCDLGVTNQSYSGILAAANTSSSVNGTGVFIARGCRDISGRAASAPTLGFQVKEPSIYRADAARGQVILQANRNFNTISLTKPAVPTQGVDYSGRWKLLGGDWQGTVASTIDGDNMGYI